MSDRTDPNPGASGTTPRGVTPVPFFDAHLDLAYLAVNKRNMLASLGTGDRVASMSLAPHPPGAVTLRSLAPQPSAFSGVRLALGTIFTEPVSAGLHLDSPEKYATDDAAAAHKAGRAQLEVYLSWRDARLIDLDFRRRLRTEPGTGEIRGGMGVSEPVPPLPITLVGRLPAQPPITLGVLVENADPIRSPDELEWWHERGVVAIGLAWAKRSRYAGGNATTEGLSDLGRELVRQMDRLRIVHDASHLSDRTFADLLAATNRPVMASHSNCRALLGDATEQRHLSDDQIRRVAERGGVIGLNLFSRFLEPAARESGRASIESCVRHIEHVCDIAQDRLHIGLGTDMDGGFAADRLPEGIDQPSDLVRLLDALHARGWSDAEVFGFACGNWVRFFNAAL